jgi:hypothetical protein
VSIASPPPVVKKTFASSIGARGREDVGKLERRRGRGVAEDRERLELGHLRPTASAISFRPWPTLQYQRLADPSM